MIKLESAQHEGEPEVVELFEIDGKAYTVPAKPRVGVGLRYLRNVRKIGVALAESALLEDLLGAEGYEALCGFEDLTNKDMAAVSEAAAKLALGSLENVDEGNGDGESPKSAG